MNKTEAMDVGRLLRWVTGLGSIPDEGVQFAAGQLAERAYTALAAGPRDHEITAAWPKTSPPELAAEVERLKGRLRVAEAVCVMYGICPARYETEREKAAYEVWLTWAELVGPGATTAHPDLTDERIAELARQRDAKRTKALAGIEKLVNDR